MSQPETWGVPRSGPAAPSVYAARDDDSLDALLSQHSGATAPPYAVAGTRWADTSVAGTITLKEYDGTDWIVAGTIDTAANTFTPAIPAGGVTLAMLAIGGAVSGFRNLLINSLGTINQRVYVSGAATSAANQYTVDRWRVVTSGHNLSWTESAGVRTLTAPAGGVEQIVEGSAILSGTYVLNWEGTATATVDGSPVSKGGTVTLTGGTNAVVRFTGGTFTKPQLEPGGVATPFELRPIGAELALCQRYFERTLGTWIGGLNAIYALISFKVRKRVTPTIGGTIFASIHAVDVDYVVVYRASGTPGIQDMTVDAEI